MRVPSLPPITLDGKLSQKARIRSETDNVFLFVQIVFNAFNAIVWRLSHPICETSTY